MEQSQITIIREWNDYVKIIITTTITSKREKEFKIIEMIKP